MLLHHPYIQIATLIYIDNIWLLLIASDTHFRHNVKKCALCNKETLKIWVICQCYRIWSILSMNVFKINYGIVFFFILLYILHNLGYKFQCCFRIAFVPFVPSSLEMRQMTFSSGWKKIYFLVWNYVSDTFSSFHSNQSTSTFSDHNTCPVYVQEGQFSCWINMF